MRGMTKLQFVEVLEFIEKHHKFCLFRRDEERQFIKDNYPNLEPNYGFNIKYIETNFDTRDGSIWAISFRASGIKYDFRTNSLVGHVPTRNPQFNNLYETVMAFLKGELNNPEWFLANEVER